jgi:proteasome lid subunit RPN8/RPN11
VPLKIPQKIQDKIDYLCQSINKVEWSGVMFYSVKGSIRDFTEVELTVEDIYPMDMGDAAATGYELGEEFVEYRMDNPETLGWKIGMIHSHHHMKAYFSATDMEELDDNTEFHNYYLSLVVNNHGALVAKVAFRGDINGYGCKDEKGEEWTLKLSKERQVMFTFDCKILSPRVLTKVPTDFTKRTGQIIADKKRKEGAYKKKAESFQSKDYKQKNLPPWKKNQNPFDYPGFDGDIDAAEAEMWNKSFERDPIKGKTEMTEEERTWDFVRYLLRLADSTEIVGDDLESALEDSQLIENKQEYLSSVITMYPAIFEKYWNIFGEIDTETFENTTIEVLTVLDEFQGMYDIIDPLMYSLESMLTKMKVH